MIKRYIIYLIRFFSVKKNKQVMRNRDESDNVVGTEIYNIMRGLGTKSVSAEILTIGVLYIGDYVITGEDN